MGISVEVRGQLVLRFRVLFPHLNERQQRLVLGQEARLLGHGGVRAVARAAGVSETTVRAGVFELEAGEDPLPDGRVRRPGGGRRAAEDLDPDLVPALLALVEPDERGDPMSPLRWTTKSLRNLAEELIRQGYPVSAPTVGRLLREQGFSLQANTKTLEGKQHPDRDAQFRYVNEQVKAHQVAGQPVISVDAKKKEQLGHLPNAGRLWRPKGDPVQAEDHSFFFTGPDVPHAIPFGIYDMTADRGWVNVGVDHNTSAFAVASIRGWWTARGRHDSKRHRLPGGQAHPVEQGMDHQMAQATAAHDGRWRHETGDFDAAVIGVQDSDVARIHEALETLGRNVPAAEADKQIFGTGTVAVLKAIQSDLGIPATGVAHEPARPGGRRAGSYPATPEHGAGAQRQRRLAPGP